MSIDQQQDIQNLSSKTVHGALSRRNCYDVVSGISEKLNISGMVRLRAKAVIDHKYEVDVDLSESIIKNCSRRPLAEKLLYIYDVIPRFQKNLNISEMVRVGAITTIDHR